MPFLLCILASLDENSFGSHQDTETQRLIFLLQPVLRIVDQRVGHAAHRAPGHVAVAGQNQPRISLICTNSRILSCRFVQFVAENRADGLLDPVAVPVVHIAGRDAPGHRSQPVFCTTDQRDV